MRKIIFHPCRKSLIRKKGRSRSRIKKEITQQQIMVHTFRDRLARAKISAHVTPLAGLEWFLALTLWFFNATCWTAWFGTSGAEKLHARHREHRARHMTYNFMTIVLNIMSRIAKESGLKTIREKILSTAQDFMNTTPHGVKAVVTNH